MRRYAVFGGGMMGRVVAQSLLDSEPEAEVYVCDGSDDVLRDIARAWSGVCPSPLAPYPAGVLESLRRFGPGAGRDGEDSP